jgi:hypothetical protein
MYGPECESGRASSHAGLGPFTLPAPLTSAHRRGYLSIIFDRGPHYLPWISASVFRTPGDAIHSEKQRAYGDNHLSKRSTRYRACCPLAHMLHENATHAKPPEKPCVDARIARRPRRHRSEATPSAILYKDVMGEDCPTTGLCPHPQRRRTLLPRRRQHSGLDST